MSRKNSYDDFDGFDELDEWEGAVRVRHRWHEHEPIRRHTGGHEEGSRGDKSKPRRRHVNPRGDKEG